MLPEADPIVRAAVERFAHDGFTASLRTVAEDAGVSAALLIKRFGSKDGLREACDEFVLRWVRTVKEDSVDAAARGGMMGAFPARRDQAVQTGYMLQSVLDGGAAGRQFLDHMIADAEDYIADAVARGLARPSRDEKARARYMVQAGIGSLLVSLLLADPAERFDLTAMLRRLRQETMSPAFELYTDGFFTTRAALENIEQQLSAPPQDDTDPSPDPPDPA